MRRFARGLRWSLWLVVLIAFSGFVALAKDARRRLTTSPVAQWDSAVVRDSLALFAFEDTARQRVLALVAALPGSVPRPAGADADTAIERSYLERESRAI